MMTVSELKRALGDCASVEALIHGQLAQARPDETSGKKPYYRLRVVDARDGLDINAWSDTPAFAAVSGKIVATGDFVELQGVFSKTDRGLNTQGLSIRALTAEEKATLINGSAERRDELDKWEAELVAAIVAMEDPLFKTLSKKIFSKVRIRFKRAAAAIQGASRPARRVNRTHGFHGAVSEGDGRVLPGHQSRFNRLRCFVSRLSANASSATSKRALQFRRR